MDVAAHMVGDGWMSETLVISGMVTCGVSGLVGLLFTRSNCVGQWLSTITIVAGCILGLTGVAVYWGGGNSAEIVLPWSIPGGPFRVAIDGLSAMFLPPIFLIAALGSIYGLSYWKQTEHVDNGRKLRVFYGFLAAVLSLLVVARNGLVFLAGWEMMTLSAFFLVTTEDQQRETRRAGWIYLAASHVCMLCLFALFSLLASASGSFQLRPLSAAEISPHVAAAVFVLAVAAFGLKAGLMPLHIWLPGAHATAPSHVSAIMSGVLIKMGVYGILRVTSLLPNPPLAWGLVLLAFGAISGVLGVAYAIGQHDIKRLLAYHSIENIGIIVMGAGLALVGRSLGRADWIVFGLAGSLLHVWNHALFKALLFFGAGSVIHATGTREIDQLGGLAKKMPYTALCFLIGAVAICGLPPLNGFVSEFLIYLGLFRALGADQGPAFIGTAFATPALAFIGALAVACFVKVFGVVFLGTSRSSHAEHAHKARFSMILPMLVLAACCFLIGLAPMLVVPALSKAIHAWASEIPESAVQLAAYAPLSWISTMGLLLLISIAVAAVVLKLLLRPASTATDQTWSCGYAAPTPRMQYTSSSFAQMLVSLFAWALRPKKHQPTKLPLFPETTSFHSDVPDAVLEEGVLPTFRLSVWLLGWFRVFQQGNIQAYLLYILLTLLALLFLRWS